MARLPGSKDKKPRLRHSTAEYVQEWEKKNPEEAKKRSEIIKQKIEEWKKNRGTPPDYKPEYCEQLIEHMAKGAPFDTFCSIACCGTDVLYGWVARYPEFASAKKFAEKLSHEWWEKQGRKGLKLGPSKFHGQVWSITMKNRFGYRDKQEVTLQGADGGPILLQKSMNWNAASEARLKELRERSMQVERVLNDEDILDFL